MACRNPQKADAARKKIMDEIPDADLDVMILDLASQKSVADFADAFLEKYERLDTLVNNAGIMAAPYSETVDGFENHFATNYLGHFALTARLFCLWKRHPGQGLSVSAVWPTFLEIKSISIICTIKTGKDTADGGHTGAPKWKCCCSLMRCSAA